ncbi:MAG TPA: cyclopropane-fatty-acyl-phospholipid synthase family protein [Opitutaceae bacterium]|nr:cyclopropane-fatty-acyl-phospholipid synthase family protein [Opitutaceae bacterium]
MNSEPGFFSASAVDSRSARPSAFRAPVLAAFSAMARGRLQVDLPEGATAEFGAGPEPLPLGVAGSARIRVHRDAFFRKCVLSGDIGFAESYIDGDWTSPDLVAVVAWFLLNVENAPTVSGSGRARSAALNLLRVANRLGHAMRPNSRAMARRNIGDHYDLSNDFFALFLDPSMMYSSARWARPGITLEEAQVEKNESLCRSLRLSPDDHVLEIGTGWGGWAIHAARVHGSRVTTVTLSRRQFEQASLRVAQAGLADRVTVRLQDFRGITGVYDKVASIEMVEALGHRYLPEFCRVVNRSLKRDGLLGMQFITCPDPRYGDFRRGVDFIQKHIFPGSLLLSLNRFSDLLSREAGMILHGAEDMGRDYALTLRRWAESFASRTEEVRALGFDDRFVRKWAYYLAYCEAAFAMRNISVVQTVHTRPNNLSL